MSALIISVTEYPNWPVTGYIGDLVISVPSPFNTAYVLLVPLMDLADEKIRKLFRSLSLIIIANIGGYVIFMIGINVFLSVLSPSSPYFWHANVYLSITDYKAAFRKQFAAIKSSLLKLKYYLFNPTQQSTTMVQKY
uniref:Uncharacterized protein n=1 Tax=Meloidogyne floridensis TaxID=298350 RepID=A0A915P8S3_9BILA